METVGIKKCTSCKTEYLEEEFYRRSDRDQLMSQCKFCYGDAVKKRQRKRRAERKEAYKNGEIQPIEEKWCKLCDDVKSWEEFYIKYDATDLLSHYCRECHKKDNLMYRYRTNYKRKNADNS